jgi:Cu-Zn family superoxide dismutase
VLIKLALAALAPLAFAVGAARAESVEVPMALATPAGPGAAIGSVRFSDSPSGVVIDLDLSGVAPGEHGLHVHLNPSCAPSTAADGTVTPAGGAGPHLDPAATGKHLGPHGAGHLGDLPRVEADAAGRVRGRLSAPRIASVAALRGHALMLHAGGDTYSDEPKPLGGGGPRLACGVIPAS